MPELRDGLQETFDALSTQINKIQKFKMPPRNDSPMQRDTTFDDISSALLQLNNICLILAHRVQNLEDAKK